jgi:hypothetical protein
MLLEVIWHTRVLLSCCHKMSSSRSTHATDVALVPKLEHDGRMQAREVEVCRWLPQVDQHSAP